MIYVFKTFLFYSVLIFFIFSRQGNCEEVIAKNSCNVFNPNQNLIDKIDWAGFCENGNASGFGVAKFWNGDVNISIEDGYFEEGRFIVGKKTPRVGKAIYCKSDGKCVTDFGNNEYRAAFSGSTSDKEGKELYEAYLSEITDKVRISCNKNKKCINSDVALNIINKEIYDYRNNFISAKSASDFKTFIDKYSTNDIENLIPQARIKFNTVRIIEYNDDYNNAMNSSSLQSFINKYRDFDPNKLISKAKLKLKLALENERNEQEKRDAEERYRIAHACDRFYSGKVIGFKPAGFIYFGNSYSAVVLGSGNGMVSFKITEGSLYGRTLEASCTSDQIQ